MNQELISTVNVNYRCSRQAFQTHLKFEHKKIILSVSTQVKLRSYQTYFKRSTWVGTDTQFIDHTHLQTHMDKNTHGLKELFRDFTTCSKNILSDVRKTANNIVGA